MDQWKGGMRLLQTGKQSVWNSTCFPVTLRLQSLDVLPSWICKLVLCFSSKGHSVTRHSSPFKNPSLIGYLSVNPTKQRVYQADTIFCQQVQTVGYLRAILNHCLLKHVFVDLFVCTTTLGVVNGLDLLYSLQFIPWLHITSWFIGFRIQNLLLSCKHV